MYSNYVDKASAQSLGLAKTSGSSFVFAADDTTVLSATGAGRNSVRVQSVNAYGSGHVSVYVGILILIYLSLCYQLTA